MEQDHDLKHIKRNSIISVFSLFFQSGYAAFLGLITQLVITILLTKTVYGIYITTLSIIAILNYFSDIGLAASLVQKKEVSEDDIASTFTIQQLLVVGSIGIFFFLTPVIRNFYHLPANAIYLYWTLLFSFFISSLKTIPSVLLERKIQFQKIVFVQVLESTLFYITVIILAILKFDLQSFTYAVILRSVAGLIAMYSLSFWLPHFAFSKTSLRKLLTFGIPFQASSFLALFKDDFMTLYLAKVLGFEGIGILGWGKKWAEAPIRIIMDNVSRVLFPVISRLQHEQNRISQVINKIIFYQSNLLIPIFFGMILTADKFMHLIPGYYQKWSSALPFFYLFCISAIFSSYSTPFINLFNALGKVKLSFSFMVFWTVASWILTPILTHYYGLFGFPITLVILSSTFIVVSWKARQFISFELFPSVYPAILSGAIMSILVFFLFSILKFSFINLCITVLLASLIYYLFLTYMFKINLIGEIKYLLKHE